MSARGVPWLSMVLIAPWLVLEVLAPVPRSHVASFMFVVALFLAATGVAILFTRFGLPMRWVRILGFAGIFVGMGLIFLLGVGSATLFTSLIVVGWGLIGRAMYLFWIHPREV